jgi:hypothetical protein
MTTTSTLPFLSLAAIAACLGGVPGASAQSQRCTGTTVYRGRCVDVPLVRADPGSYGDCGSVRGRSQPEVYACFLAVTEAKNMATYHAGGHGRLLGFHRGFASGMHEAERRAGDDVAFLNEGRRSVDRMEAYMATGLRASDQRGDSAGRRGGVELARSLFERAVTDGRSGQLPARAMGAVPAPDYPGEDNGYRRFVPQNGEFANPGIEETLRAMERDYARYNGAYGHIDRTTRMYMGDYTRLTLRELWYDDGIYPFDARRLLDPQIALRAWLTQPGISRAHYDTLNRGAPPDIERNPSSGDPVLGPDGKAICKRPLRDNAGTVTGCATIDLQAVFQRSFLDVYRFYVGHAYSSRLYDGLDAGYREGSAVGAELGRRIAQTRGMVQAFDESFKERTRSTYASAFQRGYESGFRTEFEAYRTSPGVRLEVIDVIGSVADGILQPGETFSLTFRVTNAGGVRTTISGRVSGTVENASPVQDSIGALTRREFTTGIVGRVDPRLRPGERAEIRFAVNGVEAAAVAPVVRRAIQLAPVGMAVNAPAGSGVVRVAMRNVSTVRTSGEVVAFFALGGQETRRSLGVLNPGDSPTLTFELSSQDPLRLMFGGVAATVRVQVGDVVMDEQNVRLLTEVPRQDLARYFGLLAQPGAQGYVPPGTDRAERLGEVIARVVSINENETRGARSNMWKDAPHSTMAGIVRDELQSAPPGDIAASRFRELGDRLWGARTNLGKFLFIKSGKRKSYERIVQEIRSTGRS